MSRGYTLSISELVRSIDRGEYSLPEFQRGYVWSTDKVKGLFSSLYKGYPTGTLLIWKSSVVPKTRNNEKSDLLIVDGQQRLTTLYAIISGNEPLWFEGRNINRNLYFHLDKEEFRYYQPSIMEGDNSWINVSEFLQIGLSEYMGCLQERGENELLIKYLRTFTKLNDILKYEYYIQEISGINLEEVVDIFNLVNSRGTSLTNADFSLALVTSRWEGCKEKMREAVEKYDQQGFYLSIPFFMRSICVLGTGRGKFDLMDTLQEEELKLVWKRVIRSLDYLVHVLSEHAYLRDNSVLKTRYPLFVMLHYIDQHDGKFPSDEIRDKFLFWFFQALMWGRYSGSMESKLEQDLRILKEKKSPDDLIKIIQSSRGGNLEVDEKDLELQGYNGRFFQIFYATVLSNHAFNWYEKSMPLYPKTYSREHKVEKYFIFPKSMLYKQKDDSGSKKYNSNNSHDQHLVNEIANMCLQSGNAEKNMFTTLPQDYLKELDMMELQKQYIPENQELWQIDNYKEFLKKRRRLIARGINSFLHKIYHGELSEYHPETKVWQERIDEVEQALRKLIAQVAEDHKQDIDSSFVPKDVLNRTKSRIEKHVIDNPIEKVENFSMLEKMVDFFTIGDYRRLICSGNNWEYFESIFKSRETVIQRFELLENLRNPIAHNRELLVTAIKDGDAAISWFIAILDRYL
ncbi:DUF262 domain-containing protein [Candidatus Uabimicrobium sp. HlEnr_7]|uniref:GmrSD restriction endonuclease domain-containing protein n=1 Tax=Candidatus Uabimicrobium helgolandensis TaxID=3095367 RepID=UPI003555FD3D